MQTPKRLPPFELREGESLFINWAPGKNEVEVQLRMPSQTRKGGHYVSRVTYPIELFRRPPTAGTADWIRGELVEEQHKAMDAARTNRRPKRPRW